MNLGNRELVVVGRFVEEVVGRVRHECLLTDVLFRGTVRRCEPSRGVQPLDEGGVRQRVATVWSDFGSNRLEQEPVNRPLRDESGVGGGGGGGGGAVGVDMQLGPDGARVPRVLPRDANRAFLLTPLSGVAVGTEEMGDELRSIVFRLE